MVLALVAGHNGALGHPVASNMQRAHVMGVEVCGGPEVWCLPWLLAITGPLSLINNSEPTRLRGIVNSVVCLKKLRRYITQTNQ